MNHDVQGDAIIICDIGITCLAAFVQNGVYAIVKRSLIRRKEDSKIDLRIAA